MQGIAFKDRAERDAFIRSLDAASERTTGKAMRLKARIPVDVFFAMQKVDPHYWDNPKHVEWWSIESFERGNVALVVNPGIDRQVHGPEIPIDYRTVGRPRGNDGVEGGANR